MGRGRGNSKGFGIFKKANRQDKSFASVIAIDSSPSEAKRIIDNLIEKDYKKDRAREKNLRLRSRERRRYLNRLFQEQAETGRKYQQIILKQLKSGPSDFDRALLKETSPYKREFFKSAAWLRKDSNGNYTTHEPYLVDEAALDVAIDKSFDTNVGDLKSEGINIEELRNRFQSVPNWLIPYQQRIDNQNDIWADTVEQQGNFDLDYDQILIGSYEKGIEQTLEKMNTSLPEAKRILENPDQHTAEELEAGIDTFLSAIDSDNYNSSSGKAQRSIDEVKRKAIKLFDLNQDTIKSYLDNELFSIPRLEYRDTQYYEDQSELASSYFLELNLIGNISTENIAAVMKKIDQENFKQLDTSGLTESERQALEKTFIR